MYLFYKQIRGEVISKTKDDTFDPETTKSLNWKHWVTVNDGRRCKDCEEKQGKIYAIDEVPNPAPPLHYHCRCAIVTMDAVKAGAASKEGENGADWWLWHTGELPGYYISIDELSKLDWKPGSAPAEYAPGKMVTRGVFENRKNQLPNEPGRIWYEADLNYYSEERNKHRVLWSNDGLIFVTYDHYKNFIEVIGQ